MCKLLFVCADVIVCNPLFVCADVENVLSRGETDAKKLTGACGFPINTTRKVEIYSYAIRPSLRDTG